MEKIVDHTLDLLAGVEAAITHGSYVEARDVLTKVRMEIAKLARSARLGYKPAGDMALELTDLADEQRDRLRKALSVGAGW